MPDRPSSWVHVDSQLFRAEATYTPREGDRQHPMGELEVRTQGKARLLEEERQRALSLDTKSLCLYTLFGKSMFFSQSRLTLSFVTIVKVDLVLK